MPDARRDRHVAPHTSPGAPRPGHSRSHRARDAGLHRSRFPAGRSASPRHAGVRQRDADQGGCTRGVASALARTDPPGSAVRLPYVAPQPRIHGGRRADARARHRREHDHLHPVRGGHDADAAGRGARDTVLRRPRRAPCRSRIELSLLRTDPRTDRRLRRRHRVFQERQRQDRGGTGPRVGTQPDRQRQLPHRDRRTDVAWQRVFE